MIPRKNTFQTLSYLLPYLPHFFLKFPKLKYDRKIKYREQLFTWNKSVKDDYQSIAVALGLRAICLYVRASNVWQSSRSVVLQEKQNIRWWPVLTNYQYYFKNGNKFTNIASRLATTSFVPTKKREDIHYQKYCQQSADEKRAGCSDELKGLYDWLAKHHHLLMCLVMPRPVGPFYKIWYKMVYLDQFST